MKYQAMEELRHQYPLPPMCRLLGVSASGYYTWRRRGPSLRAARATPGSGNPRRRPAHERDVRAGAAAEGSGRTWRAGRSASHSPVAPNLLEQRFAAEVPDQVWAGDRTYIATDEGWLYLAGFKELYSGEREPSEPIRPAAFSYRSNGRQRNPSAGTVKHDEQHPSVAPIRQKSP